MWRPSVSTFTTGVIDLQSGKSLSRILQQMGSGATDKVWSFDSDLFIILLLHIHETAVSIQLETRAGNRKKLITITEIAEDFAKKCASAHTTLNVLTNMWHHRCPPGHWECQTSQNVQKIQNSKQFVVN